MMILMIVLSFLLWLFTGWAIAAFWWTRTNDLTYYDAVFCALPSILGPFVLMLFVFDKIKLSKLTSNDVLIKKRRNKNGK